MTAPQIAARSAGAVQQRSPEWHELRRVSIGSSDMPVLAGLSPWKSEYELAMEKLGLMPPEPESDRVDPRLVGTVLEPAILELYKRQSGRQAKRQFGVRKAAHLGLPWAIASLDALTVNERPNRIVELKHSYAARWRGHVLPEDVEIQVMWQMGVAGYTIADVCALIYGLPRIFEVPFDESYFGDLVRIAERFRERLTSGEMPAIDGSDSARRAIVARYPIDDGSWLRPSDEANVIARAIRDAEVEYREAKDRLGTAENAMRAILGDASGIGSLRIDGWQISFKASRDSTKVDWEAIATAYRIAMEREILAIDRGDMVTTMLPSRSDLDAIIEENSVTKPGSRRLLTRFDLAEEEAQP